MSPDSRYWNLPLLWKSPLICTCLLCIYTYKYRYYKCRLHCNWGWVFPWVNTCVWYSCHVNFRWRSEWQARVIPFQRKPLLAWDEVASVPHSNNNFFPSIREFPDLHDQNRQIKLFYLQMSYRSGRCYCQKHLHVDVFFPLKIPS